MPSLTGNVSLMTSFSAGGRTKQNWFHLNKLRRDKVIIVLYYNLLDDYPCRINQDA